MNPHFLDQLFFCLNLEEKTKQSFGIDRSKWCLPRETAITISLKGRRPRKTKWLRAQIQILGLLLCVTLGKLLYSAMLQIPQLQKGDNNYIFFVGLLQSIIFIMLLYAKSLNQCLAHSKHLIMVVTILYLVAPLYQAQHKVFQSQSILKAAL